MIQFHFGKWFVNAHGFYWLPSWLNSITWEKGKNIPRAYRWLYQVAGFRAAEIAAGITRSWRIQRTT